MAEVDIALVHRTVFAFFEDEGFLENLFLLQAGIFLISDFFRRNPRTGQICAREGYG